MENGLQVIFNVQDEGSDASLSEESSQSQTTESEGTDSLTGKDEDSDYGTSEIDHSKC
jgi:hypothetical protein